MKRLIASAILILATGCNEAYWKITETELEEKREWTKHEDKAPTRGEEFSKTWHWERR